VGKLEPSLSPDVGLIVCMLCAASVRTPTDPKGLLDALFTIMTPLIRIMVEFINPLSICTFSAGVAFCGRWHNA
jgi:predicted metal-binding protein